MLSALLKPVLAFVGWQEGLLIVAIILLLFGARKIPELMRGIGSGVREFKEGVKEPIEEVKAAVSETKSALTEDNAES